MAKDKSRAREIIRQARADGRRVGLVPTMGALHAGHLSLIHAAREDCDFVAVTIFVNPAQFGPHEDFDSYPRTLAKDLSACESAGADLVFTPDGDHMYPPDASTKVHVAALTERLCGAHRPGHFDGVTTVVTKLFHILPADVAYFGEKDYQQLQTIRRMVRDLDMPIEIAACPIVREDDGLAMSSRNRYLAPAERQGATSLYRALARAQRMVSGGEPQVEKLIEAMRETIERTSPTAIDYVEIVDANSLQPMQQIHGSARALVAVRYGETRLIDNASLDLAASAG